MLHRPVSLHAPRGSVAADVISQGIDALLEEYREQVRLEFPAEVLAEAERAASRASTSAGAGAGSTDGGQTDIDRSDRTDIPFVTLDPESSTDLDQAMHLERTDIGYRVLYAIADVPLFVELGSALDAEARRRGATVYLPDRRIPLHPEVLSEGVASLLPEQDTPAFVWTFELDAAGIVTSVDLERATVRSVAKLDYDTVQQQLDAGQGHPTMQLLQEIGDLRLQQEAERGGASLNVPEQEVEAEGDHVRLTWRDLNAIEEANAQISLMTGMAAAQLMIDGGAGILRTMPPAEPQAIARFRRQTQVLGTPWEENVAYGDFLRSLDWRDAAHLALLNQATSLFRGASYAAFTRPEELPEDPAQAAIAAPYAHATAPLRRLVDRFVLLVCHAHARGQSPDPALLAALEKIPEAMRSTATKAGELERRAIELVETAALEAWVGEEFDASVIERREASEGKNGNGGAPTRVEVQLIDPPVTAWVPMDAEAGQVVRVRLESVDPRKGKAHFVPAGPAGADAAGTPGTADATTAQSS